MTASRHALAASLVARSVLVATLTFACAASAEGAGAGADRDVPRGRPRAPDRSRPSAEEAPLAACSFARPVCVHTSARVRPTAALAVLSAAEAAFDALDALRLPRPRADAFLGGSDAFDVYVLPGAGAPTTTIDLVADDARFDEASAFVVMSPPDAISGCTVGSDVARSIFEAVVLGLDAGAEDQAIAMASSYFATIAAPCSVLEDEAVDDFQARPDAGLVDARRGRLDGALLFPWFLDDELGYAADARVITALLAVATQKTPERAFDWQNEPDVFDALRQNESLRGATLDALLSDFSIARAFVGDRDDRAHLHDVGRFGAFGRVAFEWSVPFDSLPRRLAPRAPIEPTGAAYIWIDLAGAPKGAELHLAGDWETNSLFRFAIVKVAASGEEVGRVDVPAMFGATHVDATVTTLDDLAGLIVVATNAGSPDRSHPFDPDEAPFVPHAFTVTLYR